MREKKKSIILLKKGNQPKPSPMHVCSSDIQMRN